MVTARFSLVSHHTDTRGACSTIAVVRGNAPRRTGGKMGSKTVTPDCVVEGSRASHVTRAGVALGTWDRTTRFGPAYGSWLLYGLSVGLPRRTQRHSGCEACSQIAGRVCVTTARVLVAWRRTATHQLRLGHLAAMRVLEGCPVSWMNVLGAPFPCKRGLVWPYRAARATWT